MEEFQLKNYLISEKEAAEFLGFTIRFLQARRVRGNGPRFVKISSRAIRYRVSDLREWVEDKLRTSTSEQ